LSLYSANHAAMTGVVVQCHNTAFNVTARRAHIKILPQYRHSIYNS
jgi:hypothetical protein